MGFLNPQSKADLARAASAVENRTSTPGQTHENNRAARQAGSAGNAARAAIAKSGSTKK